jgi:signal transduction histidine kinase
VSDIGSTIRRHWVELAWAAFAAANLVVILVIGRWETIPFHFVWVSLTLLYGYRVWGLRATFAVLVGVMVTTGAALIYAVLQTKEPWDEVTEVPLMAGMFLAMVWHARRAQAATERARAAAASEHRLRGLQRSFVRDASHQLRTPITVARGHAELIRQAVDDRQVARDVDVVLDELRRLSRMSERLLLIAASEDPGFLRKERMELEPFVVGIVGRWMGTAKRTWRVEVVEDGTVPADEERLAQALDALLENALEFTREGDAINVVARAHGSDVIVEVNDTGSGFDPDLLGRIFEPFARGTPDRVRHQGGTGLGLAIVKAIVDAHGGSVRVANGTGAGSTVQLRLPGFTPSDEDGSRGALVAGNGHPEPKRLD